MAGLTPAEIAFPIRSELTHYKNITVIYGKVSHIDKDHKNVTVDQNTYEFDYLIVACGATHSYFGKHEWQNFAPGMKTIEQALEIRRRILLAFELAERETDHEKVDQYMTFVVVGGGPTGVELAGSLVEMAKYTLAKDFKHIYQKGWIYNTKTNAHWKISPLWPFKFDYSLRPRLSVDSDWCSK